MFAQRASYTWSWIHSSSRSLREDKWRSCIVGLFSLRKNLSRDVIMLHWICNQTIGYLIPLIGSCIIRWSLVSVLPHAFGLTSVIIWILQNSRLVEVLVSRFIEVILVHINEFLISLNLTLQFLFHLLLLLFFNLHFLLHC